MTDVVWCVSCFLIDEGDAVPVDNKAESNMGKRDVEGPFVFSSDSGTLKS